jgi:hypothetical protein
MPRHSSDSPAGIQYAGLAGVSQSCLDAVRRFIQFGDHIKHAFVLTAGHHHALLLELEIQETIAIRPGFGSGYSGAGPHALADVLELLHAHGAEIDECEVSTELLERINDAALTRGDLARLEEARVVRPSRWYDYVFAVHGSRANEKVWSQFPSVMPWRIIDPRIIDLAKKFFDDADNAILVGFRRLEDIVRARIGADEHGAKLFSQAFLGDGARLEWKGINSSEQTARAQIFTGTFSAFRNPRAHREAKSYENLREFLALNLMFVLEAEARPKAPQPSSQAQPPSPKK